MPSNVPHTSGDSRSRYTTLVTGPAYSDLPGFKPYMDHCAEYLRRLMLANGWDWRCYDPTCGITLWNGRPAPLQIDHIDGNRKNNLRSNLRFLCPNCHALTSTYAGRNKKQRPEERLPESLILRAYAQVLATGEVPTLSSIARRAQVRLRGAHERERVRNVCGVHGLELKSRQPRRTKILWPADCELQELLRTRPRTEVAAMLGVSDVAVRKRCQSRNIPEPNVYRLSVSARTAIANRASERRLAQVRRDPQEDLRRKRVARLSESHGTVCGYRLEIRLGFPTCGTCRAANSADAAQRRRTAA